MVTNGKSAKERFIMRSQFQIFILANLKKKICRIIVLIWSTWLVFSLVRNTMRRILEAQLLLTFKNAFIKSTEVKRSFEWNHKFWMVCNGIWCLKHLRITSICSLFKECYFQTILLFQTEFWINKAKALQIKK